MSFFDRLRAVFGRVKTAPEPVPSVLARPVPEATLAMQAAHLATTRAWSDALSLLRSSRGTADEGAVVDAIALGLPDEAPDHDQARHAWDALIVQLADVLVARGDPARACDQLRRARSSAAKVLRADLLCDGATTRSGAARPEDLDLALALYAEALRDDIDAPGARERWDRLRTRLGRSTATSEPTIGATLLTTSPSLPFTLVHEVARGGSGVVYRARASLGGANERIIALKLAHAQSREGMKVKTMLAHEARVAARFRGAGVVPIFDVDPEEGWLAMAWADGGSLRERIRRADPELVSTARVWLGRLCRTLADVHGEGWLHGDVKPANVLFNERGERGEPWLGDFALARPTGDPQTPGSAGYVSPERIAGAPCDARDDVFAIGRILEELVDAGADPSLRPIARACIARDRPPDATAVLELLR